MKRFILIAVYLIPFCLITKISFSQSSIIGIWLTQDKEAKVQIYKTGNKYFGKIVWLNKPFDEKGNPVLDEKNTNNGLKRRQLMNLVILNGFIYVDNEWTSGTLYDPTDGNNYECKMWIENSNTLKVRGYLGFLYETETWIRVK